MGARAVCNGCGGIFHTDSTEWSGHYCPTRRTLEDFESLRFGEREWYLALLQDDNLYFAILEGIGKATEQFKTKYGRLPEARHNGKRNHTNGNPQRTRRTA